MFILGAGTLGELALETAVRARLTINGFYDDFSDAKEFNGVPVLGRLADFRNDPTARAEGAFVAVGDNFKRQACVESIRALGVRFQNIIDPSATLSPTASIGEGNLVLPHAHIGTKSSLGSHNIIFSGVSITHHNTIGDYCFFSPNASIGGYSKLGNCCKIGMNCVISPYLTLGSGINFAPLSIISHNTLS